MNLRIVIVTVGYWVLIVGSQPMSAPSMPGGNPAEGRSKEFAQAVSTGSPDALKRLVADSFSEGMQRLPMTAHMNILMSYWDMSHGLDFYRAQSSEPDSVVALFKNRLTGGWNAVYVRVDSQAPYRIVSVQPRIPEPPDQSERALSDRQIARELGDLMKRLAAADTFSGAVALARDGRIIFEGAYGQGDKNAGTANRTDTKFNLGSMNKMFTAVAIAQLVERGQLSYDDPLARFLPDFPDADTAKKIKIKNLLSHTAGLGMWWGPHYRETSKDSFRTVDDMIKWASGDENHQFEPGARYQYSNTGFVVLGKVIEKVSGMTYYDYVRENIYKPAGMESTDSYELDRVNPNLAVGYEKVFDGQGKPWFRNNVFVNFVRGGPHGGGYSTVEDLVRFGEALRSGKLLKSENVRVLQSAKPELGSTRYGYGFDVNEERGIAGHSGGGAGNSDNFDMFLRSGWTAVVLSNYTETAFDVCAPVVDKMRELVAAREHERRISHSHAG